jgi:phosphomannomutase
VADAWPGVGSGILGFMDTSDLIAVARQWIVDDPDPLTRAELEAVIEANDLDELSERMAGSLQFGTAGLRGVVAAGSNRMNRAVVIRTTRGLADYLLGRGDTDAPVVVGADARLSSLTFLEDTVAVLAAAGIPVRFFDEPVPTPLVAYAARLVEAQAAVVITASHNPPRDNGYKVYDRNGAQIIPPVDGEIAAAIADVGPAAAVPRIDDAAVGGSPLVGAVPEGWFGRYLGDLDAVRTPPPLGRDLAIVYTPMHGVGGKYVTVALQRAGYEQLLPVAEQYEPDGRFPTVAFPNPEEPGALDLSVALAEDTGADLILANDPDTDRLAVALPVRDGTWRPLSGNQIGVLLADYVLEHTSESHPIVINSIVSSPMLAAVAESYGAGFAQTLTGFKWIWNAALDLEAAGEGNFVFGYEEALGYSVGPAVRDKDGISAALVFTDLAAECRMNGITVWDRLEAMYRRDGLWVSTQKSVVRPGTEGAAEIAAAMERLAASPPSTIGDVGVAEAVDFQVGAEERPRYLPTASLVALQLEDGGRVLVRPSGTEPKLKIYVDLRRELSADESLAVVESAALSDAESLAAATAMSLGLG